MEVFLLSSQGFSSAFFPLRAPPLVWSDVELPSGTELKLEIPSLYRFLWWTCSSWSCGCLRSRFHGYDPWRPAFLPCGPVSWWCARCSTSSKSSNPWITPPTAQKWVFVGVEYKVSWMMSLSWSKNHVPVQTDGFLTFECQGLQSSNSSELRGNMMELLRRSVLYIEPVDPVYWCGALSKCEGSILPCLQVCTCCEVWKKKYNIQLHFLSVAQDQVPDRGTKKFECLLTFDKPVVKKGYL